MLEVQNYKVKTNFFFKFQVNIDMALNYWKRDIDDVMPLFHTIFF